MSTNETRRLHAIAAITNNFHRGLLGPTGAIEQLRATGLVETEIADLLGANRAPVWAERVTP